MTVKDSKVKKIKTQKLFFLSKHCKLINTDGERVRERGKIKILNQMWIEIAWERSSDGGRSGTHQRQAVDRGRYSDEVGFVSLWDLWFEKGTGEEYVLLS